MAEWSEIEREAPEFAARVRRIFEAGINKTMATLRADGSPRISATELEFVDGRVRLGMMPGSRKLADALRDPRVAIHAPSPDPPSDVTTWIGDAKFAGRFVAVEPPAGTDHPEGVFFVVDVDEVTLTYIADPPDHLVIQAWHAGRGLSSQDRY